MIVSTSAAFNSRNNIREVGGELVNARVVRSRGVHVELLSRASQGPIDWRFRQDRTALLWFRHGILQSNIVLEGEAISSVVDRRRNLVVLPQDVFVEGQFSVNQRGDYAVALFDSAMVADAVQGGLTSPRLFFANSYLERSLLSLFQSLDLDDSLRDLFVEGWALQALAILASGHVVKHASRRGGLGANRLQRVFDFVNARLDQEMTIDALANESGFGKRHFLRAFQQSTGRTPAAYVRELRIERAKELLATSGRSLTDIAVSCGFAHSQHFSNAFRRQTSITPGAYRRLISR